MFIGLLGYLCIALWLAPFVGAIGLCYGSTIESFKGGFHVYHIVAAKTEPDDRACDHISRYIRRMRRLELRKERTLGRLSQCADQDHPGAFLEGFIEADPVGARERRLVRGILA